MFNLLGKLINCLGSLVISTMMMFSSFLCLSMAYNIIQLQLSQQVVEAQVLERIYWHNSKGDKYRLAYTFEVTNTETGKITHYRAEDFVSRTVYEANPSTINIIYAANNPGNSAVLSNYPFLEPIMATLTFLTTGIGGLWLVWYSNPEKFFP